MVESEEGPNILSCLIHSPFGNPFVERLMSNWSSPMVVLIT
jgi:hypothetical protein